MPVQIDRGLAQFDYVDYHAILGIPLDADVNEIRSRYLKIARRLHPDSSTLITEKERATEILSKMVNPAYEHLSQQKERSELQVLIRLLGQRLINEKDRLQLQPEWLQKLKPSPNLDAIYRRTVEELAEKQYENLDQVLDITGYISELNMVYLLQKATQSNPGHMNVGQSEAAKTAATASTAMPTSHSQSASEPTQAVSTTNFINQYYRRAEEFFSNDYYQPAILELRDALKLDPKNSRCHSLMGMIYLKQKQLKMAKVHFTQALNSDPKNVNAINGNKEIQRLETKGQKARGNSSQKPGGGGLFGLFGGKK